MTGRELWRTEEFKALCKVLNLAWDLPSIAMTITIPVDGEVTIAQTYLTARPQVLTPKVA